MASLGFINNPTFLVFATILQHKPGKFKQMSRTRIASLQYYIRPIQKFEDFEQQVRGLCETAKDYKVHVLVFPEYFTTQLLTLGDVNRPIRDQVIDLAKQEERFVEMMSKLAHKTGLYIVAGTIPSFGKTDNSKIYNIAHVFSPRGEMAAQPKLHMTRFEDEEWMISSGQTLKMFETEHGNFSVAICYDVEFPEVARKAAQSGAHFLVTPSCTDDRQGFLRVRYCAHARAIENQMFVIQSSTVGSLPMVPAVSLNYGQASILNPCDYSFSRDGILAEGVPNQESMVIGDMDLKLVEEARKSGTTLPLRDSQNTVHLIGEVIKVKI